MADDKNKTVTNTNSQQEQPATTPKAEPVPRKLVISDDDIATKEELKKAKNDTKVDINSVLEEYQATIAKDNKSRIRNVDKTPLSIPLTKSDTLPDLAEKIITDAIVRSPADFADEMEDYSSDYRKVYGASEYYSSGNEMPKDALSKTKPTD